MKTDQVFLTLLFDEYGALLTEKQQACFDLYFNQDLSLGEIAEEMGISRQGVHDTLSRAEAALRQMEQALGNVARSARIGCALRELERCAQAAAHAGNAALAEDIRKAVGAIEI